MNNELLDASMEYSKNKSDPYDSFRIYTQDDDAIHTLMYSLRTIKEDLSDIYNLARYGDEV